MAADHHFEGQDLLPDEHALVLQALWRMPQVNELRKRTIDKFETARRLQGPPLPKAGLDWDELDHEARRQGVDVMDVFWDRAGRKAGD